MSSSVVLRAAAALLVVLAAVPAAWAHDLRATVAVRADGVQVEAGYDDDTPAERAAVTLTDADGREVAAGVTDDRGVCTVPRPAPGAYTVVVAEAGHRARVAITVPPAGGADYAPWRLDRRLAVGLGLAAIAAVTLAFTRLRRRPAPAPDAPASP